METINTLFASTVARFHGRTALLEPTDDAGMTTLTYDALLERVQQDFQLKDGSDLHLTVERWYLPNGQTIDHKGLEPDLTIALAAAGDAFDVQQSSLGYAKDTQLNAGLALLTGG